MCVFLIKNDELLGKYNEIWDKVSNVIQKGFDSELVHKDKDLKMTIRCQKKVVNTFADRQF